MPLIPPVERLRLVLQCRDAHQTQLCEHLAFAFGRDAGLDGLGMWYFAACALALARYAVDRGGGELELRVIETPRAAVEVRLTHGGSVGAAPPALFGVRDHVDELYVEWRADTKSMVTARKWLPR